MRLVFLLIAAKTFSLVLYAPGADFGDRIAEITGVSCLNKDSVTAKGKSVILDGGEEPPVGVDGDRIPIHQYTDDIGLIFAGKDQIGFGWIED